MKSDKVVRTVRIHKTVYGNYIGYMGGRVVEHFGGSYNAKLWLAAQILKGLTVSPKSYFTGVEVEKYKALV
jgi:hypothetical protein